MGKIILWFGLLLLLLTFVAHAQANEGRFTLSKENVVCEGISLWKDTTYSLTGRCQGLVYPYTEGYSNYILWAVPADGSTGPVFLDDIDEGNISASTDRPFMHIFITAEKESAPVSPSGIEIAAGDIESFRFVSQAPKVETVVTLVTATPAPAAVSQPSVNIFASFVRFLSRIGIYSVAFIIIALVFFVRRGA